MITQQARKPRENSKAPDIDPDRLYSYPEAVEVSGVSLQTLRRAALAGHLKTYRLRKRCEHTPFVVFLGARLLEWLAAGKRTGRTSAHVKAEIERVA